MTHNSHSFWTLTLCALATLGCRVKSDDGAKVKAQRAASIVSSESTGPIQIVYPSAPGSLVGIVEEVGASVVHLRARTTVNGGPAQLFPQEPADNALGSAVVFDRKGHLLSNAHLVSNAPEIIAVFPDGNEYAARVVGRDPRFDLALLQVDAPVALLQPAKFGSSDSAKVGEWLVAVGRPSSDGVIASAGILRSHGRSSPGPASSELTAYSTFLQADIDIDAAHSGGALANGRGEVIGISTATDGQQSKVSVAIPMDKAKLLFPMLAKDGKVTRAWLGVFVHPVTPDLAVQSGMEAASGALVSQVVANSPAAKAGIQAGDIIVRFDNHEVDHRSLAWLSSTSGVDRKIPVVVMRSKEARTLMLVSETMPE